MKLLVVRAHPLGSDRSRTMQLADAFVAGFRQSHPDALVEDINLYAAAVPEIDLDLLTGWDAPKAGEPFVHLGPMQQAKLTLRELHDAVPELRPGRRWPTPCGTCRSPPG